jgi:Skp family chaperone for outer membrane proteins
MIQSKYQTSLIAVLLFASLVTTTVISGDDPGKLGPVESIAFAGEDKLTVSNNEGHLSWGEETTSQLWSIGFMETGKALSQLLQAEHFLDEREELTEELKGNLAEARELITSMQEEGNSLDPESPEAPEFRKRWELARAEFQQLQRLSSEAQARLVAKQMETAYEEIIEAVNVVSERLKIDIVLRFIPPDNQFNAENPDAIIMQIRLRTALKLPEGIDITDEVLAELGLEVQ